MLNRVQIYSILGQVLSRLADNQGQELSVDQHLRLLTLVEQLPVHITLEHLSLLLTPVLAQNPDLQAKLYHWFAEATVFQASSAIAEQIPDSTASPDKIEEDQLHAEDASSSTREKPTKPDNDDPQPNHTTANQTQDTYVAEPQKFDQAPYVWNIELGSEREFTNTEELRRLVNRMHDRQLLDARQLDLPRTIQALVKHPGQVSLQYKHLTQAPAYLLLIDQRAQQDHRARIFDLLYAYLRFNDVQVQRFYFHANPKWCFNDDFPQGLPVTQLYQQNHSARLLILTYGYELFSPSTNAWSPWTKVFMQWQDRAILSPLPIREWGGREQKLAERFTLLPATPQGLVNAIETFKTEETLHWRDYLGLITDAPTDTILLQGGLIATLNTYFPDPVMRRWIAACALYPTLNWELTLHLGGLLQQEYAQPSLTSIKNLLQLVRLPWFVEGRIPDSARDELLQWLELIGEEARIRQLLLDSLNRAPAPPKGSVAYAEYRMQVVFNQWMLEQDAELKTRLEEEFSQYLKVGKSGDFVTFKRLEREVKRTELVVPESWRSSIVIEPPNAGEPSKTNPAITKSQLRKINPPLAIYFSGDQDGVDLARQYAIRATGKTTLDWAPNLTIEWFRVVSDEYQADYVLHAEEGIWYTRLPFDKRPLLLPINFREDNSVFAQKVQVAFEDFKQMAKWHYFKNLDAFSTGSTPSPLDKDWPIKIWIFEDQGNGTEKIIPLTNGHFLLELTKDQPKKKLRFELENQSPGLIYVSLLYLNQGFGVDSRLLEWPQQALEPGSVYIPKLEKSENYIDYNVDRYIKEFFWPDEKHYLKLIISRTPFDAQAFDMASLPLPNERHNVSRRKSGLTRKVQLPDWKSRTYGLFSNNPYFDAEVAKAFESGERTIQPFDMELTIPSNMVLVKGGTFQMGEDKKCKVTLSDFLIAKHQLTFEEYNAFCKATGHKVPSDERWGQGTRPVINVSWFDAVNYCNWRSQEEGLQQVYQVNLEQVTPDWTATGYRLPTEAEWEFAARGGMRSQGFTYAGSNNIEEVAWNRENSERKTQPVGQKKANELGIYDMSGNVWEWCWDWYGIYPSEGTIDFHGPDIGAYRVNRGGSWYNYPISARVTNRYNYSPGYCLNYIGFRLTRAAVAV